MNHQGAGSDMLVGPGVVLLFDEELMIFFADAVITTYKSFAWTAFVFAMQSSIIWQSIVIYILVFFSGCICCYYSYKNGPVMIFIFVGAFLISLAVSIFFTWYDPVIMLSSWTLALIAIVTLINTARCFSRELDEF